MITQSPRNFHLGDILTITTGRLVAPRHMDAVYDLLNFMTGDELFTHQLPRVAEECQPRLLEQHPQLRGIHVPGEFEGEGHVNAWLAEQVKTFGEELPVTPLDAADHTRINPLAELEQLVGRDRIIVVETGDQA